MAQIRTASLTHTVLRRQAAVGGKVLCSLRLAKDTDPFDL